MSTETTLQEVRQAAEAQLLAARTLNPRELRAASERRMALMEQLAGSDELRPSPAELQRLQSDLEVLDDRLGRLLMSSQRALRRLQLGNTVYDPSGRIREGAR